jgi:hypothetical protein
MQHTAGCRMHTVGCRTQDIGEEAVHAAQQPRLSGASGLCFVLAFLQALACATNARTAHFPSHATVSHIACMPICAHSCDRSLMWAIELSNSSNISHPMHSTQYATRHRV